MLKHLLARAACLSIMFGAPLTAQSIDVTPLGDIKTDAIGLISPETAGIPIDFWAGIHTDEAASALAENQLHRLPVLRDFMYRLALAELSPPEGQNFLHARLSFLMAHGALNQLDALLDKNAQLTPEIYPYWFDTKLLSTLYGEACAPLVDQPSLTRNSAKFIFCQAQNKRWLDAALTLDGAEGLGLIDPNIAELFHFYLDPFGLDEAELKPFTPSDPDKVIAFTLARTLGLPAPPHKDDLAIRFAELSDEFGWRTQLLAAETLAKSGAASPRLLALLYNSGVPAASGGIWARVGAFQTLGRAINSRNPETVCNALNTAWDRFAQAQLLPQLAAALDPTLAQINLDQDCLSKQVALLALRDDAQSLLFDLPSDLPETSPIRQFFEQGKLASIQGDPKLEAIQSVFAINIAQTPDRIALLSALSALKMPNDISPSALKTALRQLRANGFDAEARALTLQLLALSTS